MHTFSTLPAAEGFRMPAEYEPHRGCVMIWPVRPGSWLYGGRDAQPAFAQAARAIAESETVWMLAGPADAGAVQAEFAGDENIHVLTIETDDAWARDVGPTCVVDDHGTVRGVDWQFNAWGGMVDGLYAHWEKDNAAARAICAALGMDCYDAQHFVLEGGSIHSDGEGTILATEACLLSRGRNPELSRAEIEQELTKAAGGEVLVSFTPHLVPIKRGIFATVYLNLAPGAGAEQVRASFEAAYAGEPFVTLMPEGQLPEVKHVTGSNRCAIGFVVDERLHRVVVCAVLDNLLKGAAGQAVQNMNLLFGLPETMGLPTTALCP